MLAFESLGLVKRQIDSKGALVHSLYNLRGHSSEIPNYYTTYISVPEDPF